MKRTRNKAIAKHRIFTAIRKVWYFKGPNRAKLVYHLNKMKPLSCHERKAVKPYLHLIQNAEELYKQAFRKTVIEGLGEDPDDWYLSISQLEAKYKQENED